jgi:D-alanine-D-alanine ligase
VWDINRCIVQGQIDAQTSIGGHGIPLVGHVVFTPESYSDDPYLILRQIKQLHAPWFVKPANMGESVGISKVKEEEYLVKAIPNAMRYSRRIIVEEAVENVREFEIGILGNHKPRVSLVGEVTYDEEFYNYETKLTDETVKLHIPANIPITLSKMLQETALEIYKLLDLAGYARIDFLYDPKTSQFYLNEVTTAPYLASCSMFARLWEAGGLGYSGLLEELVELAIQHHHRAVAERLDPIGS